MATPLQVFLVTIGFGATVAGFGLWFVLGGKAEAPKDR